MLRGSDVALAEPSLGIVSAERCACRHSPRCWLGAMAVRTFVRRFTICSSGVTVTHLSRGHAQDGQRSRAVGGRSRRPARFTAVVPLCLAACSGARGASTTASSGDSLNARHAAAWRDSSPHTTRFVTVPSGVRLEVLDWGGTGEPLVFLAGLENTGHIFDDFAPRFTDHFHVLGITRRGWGASDHPDSGYSIPILVADVRAVLDSLHLTRVDLVGHSIAGQELSWIAAKDPRRVHRLVYLDAGFDYHTHPIPGSLPSMPLPTATDSASPAAGLDYVRRMSDAPIPEADFRATERFDSGGRDLGPATSSAPSAAVVVSASALAPPLSQVRAPTLAIYDWPIAAAEFLPFISATDTAAPNWLRIAQEWHAAQRDEFKAKVPKARIVELRGASHYVFLTQPDSVAHEMREFLSSAP
jgi:non-heme chloroperoxidase